MLLARSLVRVTIWRYVLPFTDEPERIRGLPYTIASDVWSLGVSLLELALNRFPFPPDGEPFLGPIELLTYITNSPLPQLNDDEARGIRWSRAFRDLVDRCLVRDGRARAGPDILVMHPAVKRSSQIPNGDIARFVARVWDWEA